MLAFETFKKLSGIAGLIGIVFGLLALAITKVMSLYVYINFGVGVLLIIFYAVFNFEVFAERLKERSTTEGGKVFLYSGIFLLILIVVNIVSARQSTRWDFTSSSIHSLEAQTEAVLSQLDAPLKVTGVFEPKNRYMDAFKQLMKQYTYSSDKVTYEVIDPDKSPGFTKQYDLKDGDVRFVYGYDDKIISTYDQKKLEKALAPRINHVTYLGNADDEAFKKLAALVRGEKFAERNIDIRLLDPSSPLTAQFKSPVSKGNIYISYARQDLIIQEIGEEAFTGAILKVNREETPVIYFTAGRGERSTDDDKETGLSVLEGAIVNEGYDVKVLSGNLLQGLPEDADIVIVAGPQSPYTAEEVLQIESYLERGGKVVLLMDPSISSPKLNPIVSIQPTGFEDFTRKWGIELGRDLVLEKHVTMFTGQTIDPYIVTQNYGSHAITEPLIGRSTFFDVVRSINVSEGGPTGELAVQSLITSSSGKGVSWAERDVNKLIRAQKADPDDKDIAGPVTLAAVAERPVSKDVKEPISNESKLLVFGDVDFISNRLIRREEFNYDLFLNSLNWMWGKDAQISIRPKMLRSSKLVLTPKQTNIIFYAAVLSIPEFVLFLGLFVYWRRRSR